MKLQLLLYTYFCSYFLNSTIPLLEISMIIFQNVLFVSCCQLSVTFPLRNPQNRGMKECQMPRNDNRKLFKLLFYLKTSLVTLQCKFYQQSREYFYTFH